MSKCTKCQQEFTEQDKVDANYREEPGCKYSHIRCPGTFHRCHICGQEIRDDQGQKAVRTPLGYIHDGCTLPKVKRESTKANPSSWIAK